MIIHEIINIFIHRTSISITEPDFIYSLIVCFPSHLYSFIAKSATIPIAKPTTVPTGPAIKVPTNPATIGNAEHPKSAKASYVILSQDSPNCILLYIPEPTS